MHLRSGMGFCGHCVDTTQVFVGLEKERIRNLAVCVEFFGK